MNVINHSDDDKQCGLCSSTIIHSCPWCRLDQLTRCDLCYWTGDKPIFCRSPVFLLQRSWIVYIHVGTCMCTVEILKATVCTHVLECFDDRHCSFGNKREDLRCLSIPGIIKVSESLAACRFVEQLVFRSVKIVLFMLIHVLLRNLVTWMLWVMSQLFKFEV